MVRSWFGHAPGPELSENDLRRQMVGTTLERNEAQRNMPGGHLSLRLVKNKTFCIGFVTFPEPATRNAGEAETQLKTKRGETKNARRALPLLLRKVFLLLRKCSYY